MFSRWLAFKCVFILIVRLIRKSNDKSCRALCVSCKPEITFKQISGEEMNMLFTGLGQSVSRKTSANFVLIRTSQYEFVSQFHLLSPAVFRSLPRTPHVSTLATNYSKFSSAHLQKFYPHSGHIPYGKITCSIHCTIHSFPFIETRTIAPPSTPSPSTAASTALGSQYP